MKNQTNVVFCLLVINSGGYKASNPISNNTIVMKMVSNLKAQVYKRIHQVVTREDSFGLILEDRGNVIALEMGYFEQYDYWIAYYTA